MEVAVEASRDFRGASSCPRGPPDRRTISRERLQAACCPRSGGMVPSASGASWGLAGRSRALRSRGAHGSLTDVAAGSGSLVTKWNTPPSSSMNPAARNPRSCLLWLRKPDAGANPAPGHGQSAGSGFITAWPQTASRHTTSCTSCTSGFESPPVQPEGTSFQMRSPPKCGNRCAQKRSPSGR